MAHSRGSVDSSRPILAMLGGITGFTPQSTSGFINFIQKGVDKAGFAGWHIDKHTDDRIGLTTKNADGKYEFLDLTTCTEQEKIKATRVAERGHNLTGLPGVVTYDSLSELNEAQPIATIPIHTLARQLVNELLSDPSYAKMATLPIMLYSFNALWAPYIQKELAIHGKSASFILIDQPTQNLLQAQKPITILKKVYEILYRVAISQHIAAENLKTLDELDVIAASGKPIEEMIDEVFTLTIPEFDKKIDSLTEKSWNLAFNAARILSLTLANIKSIYLPINPEKMAKLDNVLLIATEDTKNKTPESDTYLGWTTYMSHTALQNENAKYLYLKPSQTEKIDHFNLMTPLIYPHVNTIGYNICEQFKPVLYKLSPELKAGTPPKISPARIALGGKKPTAKKSFSPKRKHNSDAKPKASEEHTDEKSNKKQRTRQSDRQLSQGLDITEITRILKESEVGRIACARALREHGLFPRTKASRYFILESQPGIDSAMQQG